MKRRNLFLFAVACCALVLGCCGAVVFANSLSDLSEASISEVSIPSVDEIMKNGYPVNQNGETYGPDVKDWTSAGPDLLLAENAEGVVGYIRESEMPGAQVSSPEEALEYMANRAPGAVPINMYLEDGVTIIGQFLVG